MRRSTTPTPRHKKGPRANARGQILLTKDRSLARYSSSNSSAFQRSCGNSSTTSNTKLWLKVRP